MSLRDLGYRPYEGKRLPPSHNTVVMLRHGLRRAWGSWLVKIAAFVGWIPAIIGIAIVLFAYWLSQNMGGRTQPLAEAARLVRFVLDFELWIFLAMVTLGAGAGAIAEDLTHRAFQFYFAKPVTPPQYLAGRVAAVGLFTLGMTFLPLALLVIALVGTAPQEQMVERIGLLLPLGLQSLVIAAVLAAVSVAISSLSKSRALTMTAWLLVLVVPHVIAGVVSLIGDWPWLYLASIPALLGIVADALFKIEPENALRWYHAAPILGALTLGGGWLALYRLRRAEVIT